MRKSRLEVWMREWRKSRELRLTIPHISACLSVTAMSVTQAAKRARCWQKLPPFWKDFRDALGAEAADANQQVYLVTVSRVLPGTVTSYQDISQLSRSQVADMIRDALDNPVSAASGAGRPRGAGADRVLVVFLVVAKELHEDGTPHFHTVVKLSHKMRFKQAKRTLIERHRIPSHWSCSHTQVWSALSYIHIATPAKPIVDKELWVWTHDGSKLDLMEKCREPFTAAAWRKRREGLEVAAALEGKKEPCFRKLDLQALILSKHLHTKASLLTYVQDHGSCAAQDFVSKHQRRLGDFIEDAQEWAAAKVDSIEEKMTSAELLYRAASQPCPHLPQVCPYGAAAGMIFQQNANSFSPHRLAVALRTIIHTGPSKTCRVPMLVGPSNTGKSTLVYPFDDLFGPKHVFHKPALGSTFALRNITKRKRFILWDDYRPVEFAHCQTVPVASFLSLFIGKPTEVQVSQSFNDGNADVQWQHGAVFTAKQEGLWDPTPRVSAEDVRHLKNRVELFEFKHTIAALQDVESCAGCMARWVVCFSADFATGTVQRPLPHPVLADDE